jgi:hypothetical protein
MSNYTSNLEREGTLAKQGDLHWAVLRHLNDYGAKNWTFLYVRFDPGKSGEIGATLRDLIESQYVDMGPTNMVEITATGIERLKNW